MNDRKQKQVAYLSQVYQVQIPIATKKKRLKELEKKQQLTVQTQIPPK